MGNAPDIGDSLLASTQVFFLIFNIYPNLLSIWYHDAISTEIIRCSCFIQLIQVRKITFTGSTAVGKKLMAGAAGTVKKVCIGYETSACAKRLNGLGVTLWLIDFLTFLGISGTWWQCTLHSFWWCRPGCGSKRSCKSEIFYMYTGYSDVGSMIGITWDRMYLEWLKLWHHFISAFDFDIIKRVVALVNWSCIGKANMANLWIIYSYIALM